MNKKNIMDKGNNNRKGQVFVISIIIAVAVALTTSYILLNYLFKETNDDQFLGRYQSAIIDSMNDGDKVLLYLDEASKIAVTNALDEYLYGNPNPLSSVESGDLDMKYCGSYVYRKWNTINKDCYPDYNSEDFEINVLLNKNLDEILLVSSDDASTDEKYFDSLIREDADYRYTYTPDIKYTTISASTESTYTINIFKDKNTAENSGIQEYIQSKAAYSGSLIWPLPKNYYVASCFGYRGDVSTKSGVKAKPYHSGIDIPASMDTAVVASASGTVEQILYPAWGKIIINHGNGLKTSYMHMNKIADGLRVGDTVEQGQVIGYVGGRGENSANDYDPHLHFEVISTKVNLNTNYDGINAVILGKYVNPVCFVDVANPDGSSQDLSFNMNSIACNSVCNVDGQCLHGDLTGIPGGTPYKFCNVYEGVVSKSGACLKSDDAKWSIDNVELSSTDLTSDETLKITMTLINKEDTCIQLTPHFTMRGQIKTSNGVKDIVIGEKASDINLHKSTSDDPTKVEITCKFTTDETEYEKFNIGTIFKKEDNSECIIPVNKDGSKVTYTIVGEDIITNSSSHSESYSRDFEFSVKKGKSDSYIPASDSAVSSGSAVQGASNGVSSVELSKADQAKIDKTKEKLEALNIVEYISTVSQEQGVPKEIVYGLITQESGGDMTALSPTGAYGLFQVIRSYHEDRVKKECGSWDTFKTDAECQVRVGIGILKAYYDQYGSKGLQFNCGCSGNKGTNKCTDINTVYTGWDAAIRAYNTAGCSEWADYNFVDTILKYASGWGYISTSDKIVKEEISAGILGKYYISPRFNAKINLDMRLFDMLEKFANETVSYCGGKDVVKETCVEERINEFNLNLPQEYKNIGIRLSTSCDESQDMIEVNNFVEEVNDCMMSEDTECECEFTDSIVNVKSVRSVDGSTTIAYYSGDSVKESYFDYSILKDGKYIDEKSLRIGSLSLYKNNSRLYSGIKSSAKCTVVKNTFRMCLDTNYKYTVYDDASKIGEKFKTKYVQIPFAITIRDDISPVPITGLEAAQYPHSYDSVMLKWNAGPEKDITQYNIYLSDDKSYFTSKQTRDFRDVMARKSIKATPNDYVEFESIDLNNPKCIPTQVPGGIDNYCVFEYDAIDSSNNRVSVSIDKERLYYISSQKLFVYILDGSDAYNKLSTGVEKNIAVTAVDSDGDEIDNIETDERFTEGQNLVSITPQDLLEPGLASIIESSTDNSFALHLAWNAVNIYIDGTSISGATAGELTYNIYLLQERCQNGKLQEVPESSNPKTSTQDASADITLTPPASGTTADYCVYIIPTDGTLGYMEGFAQSISITGQENFGGNYNPAAGGSVQAGTSSITTGPLFP